MLEEMSQRVGAKGGMDEGARDTLEELSRRVGAKGGMDELIGGSRRATALPVGSRSMAVYARQGAWPSSTAPKTAMRGWESMERKDT
jgi:hypothetical protein